MKVLARALFVFTLTISNSFAFTPAEYTLSFKALTGKERPFIPRPRGLAIDLGYQPILDLRELIGKNTGKKLNFFKGWNPDGEAHVTVITPPEFKHLKKAGISKAEIEEIARKNEIQGSDLRVLGFGSANLLEEGLTKVTYFIIVDSLRLRFIRHKIYEKYLASLRSLQQEGQKDLPSENAWDPTWFFPHITIGFTHRDLHEKDGVLKDLKHSLDQRVRFILVP